MLKTRIIKSGFRNAWTHKIRAIFMILSVMIGIAALTVVVSLGKGTEEMITSKVQKFFSSNTIMLVSGAGKIEPNRPVSFSGKLKISDVSDIAQSNANIIEWDAVQQAPGRQAQAEGNTALVTITGQTPSAEIVFNIEITEGRFFSDAENASLARVALIAPHVCEKLFGISNPIGQMIKVDNIPFQVIGTIGPRGLDPHGIDKDDEILIPLNTLMRRVANIDYIMFAKFLVADENNIETTASQIKERLRDLHSITGNAENDFMVITPVGVKEIIKESTKIFSLYLPLLALVALGVGSVVVINLMLISISERVREIGLRKAVGAKSKDIAMQFLIEASSITISSGMLGILVGVILLAQISRLMDLPFTISWGAIIICSIISTLIGIAAGYFPAKKAAALSPIESLR